jgi:hypothetical protein
MAEGVGFEPTEACTSAVFKTAAFDHSAIPPRVAPRQGSSPLIRFRARFRFRIRLPNDDRARARRRKRARDHAPRGAREPGHAHQPREQSALYSPWARTYNTVPGAERCWSGRSGLPAKQLSGVNLDRGFESRPLRQSQPPARLAVIPWLPDGRSPISLQPISSDAVGERAIRARERKRAPGRE